MGERMFDQPVCGTKPSSRVAAVERAIGLAESLLEEVSRAHQDWRSAARMASELAQLAGSLGGHRAGDH